MELSEKSLRNHLSENHAPGGGQALLKKLQEGDVLIVRLQDGRTLTLTEPYMARRILRDVFGWSPTGGESQRM